MQIVGYETGTPQTPAALLFADDGTISREPLSPGRKLSYRLQSRHCAGAVVDDTHIPCSNAATPFCQTHTETWVCARCTGDCLKPEPDCDEPHALYLAVFAPATFKVGVTKVWRLQQRLYEQGADKAAHLQTFPDGRLARRREAELATDIGDRVRVQEKLDGIHRSVEDSAWQARLDRFEPITVVTPTYTVDLDHAPVPETIAAGTVQGTKGRILLLDRQDTVYAVDMRTLVGYTVTEGAPTRARQASLTSF